MVEANPSLTQAQRLAQRQTQAVRVLCERRAQEEIKDRLRRQGQEAKQVPRRMRSLQWRGTRLVADAAYRARLIAEAKAIVEQWQWGPRGGLRIT